MESSQLIT